MNKIVVENDLIKTFDDSHNMFMNIEYSITIMTLPIGNTVFKLNLIFNFIIA